MRQHAVVERAQNVETLRLGMELQFSPSSIALPWTKYLSILVYSVLIDPEICLSCKRVSDRSLSLPGKPTTPPKLFRRNCHAAQW